MAPRMLSGRQVASRQALPPGPVTLYGPNNQPISSYNFGTFQDPNRWPSPGTPLQPQEPEGTDPRVFGFQAGYNLAYSPRGQNRNLTPFASLRILADTCDLIRLAIQDYKNQVIALEWDVTTKDEAKKEGREADIAAAKKKIEKPDGIQPMHLWLSKMVEEALVTDALSVYRRRTEAGDPHSLVILDGTTITPIVDVNGLPPDPPDPAYYQIVQGVPKVWMTRPFPEDVEPPPGIRKVELLYLPRNPRTWTPYGISPVEFVIIAVNLALRRQMFYLSFYTDGTLPDALYKLPESWTPKSIKEFQQIWKENLAGDDAERRGLRFVPGGTGAGLENPKGHEEWKYEFDEWLGRVICWAFNISHLPISKMMNRAVAEQADVGETDSGLKPIKQFIREFFTSQLNDFYGYPDLQMVFTSDKTVDQEFERQRAVDFIDRGLWTIDDVIVPMGKKPSGIPRFIRTPSGPVFFDDLLSLTPEERRAALAPKPPPGAGEGAVKPGEEGNLPPEAGSEGGKKPPPGKGAGEKGMPEEAKTDLRRWRTKVMKAVKAGRRAPSFETKVVPEGLRIALAEWCAHARTAEDVAWAFKALPRAKRPAVAARKRIRAERELRRVVGDHFKKHAPLLADKVLPHYKDLMKKREEVKKAEGGEGYDGPTDGEVKESLAFDDLMVKIRPILSGTYADAESSASNLSGIEVEFGITDTEAIDYAYDRSAELVGMRVLPDGTLIDNPNPKWSVPQSVRDTIRQKVEQALEEGWSEKELQEAIEGGRIWDWRSDMIARTETAFALNAGTASIYKKAGVERVLIYDGPGCLIDGHDDDEAGVDGEVWTVEEWMDNPIGHPNCRRDAGPILEE